MSDIAELIQLMSLSSRPDVRSKAMEYVLGLTAGKVTHDLFENKGLVKAGLASGASFFSFSFATVIGVMGDKVFHPVANDAVRALVNLSANEERMRHDLIGGLSSIYLLLLLSLILCRGRCGDGGREDHRPQIRLSGHSLHVACEFDT